jgi:hypothetical protein
MTTLPGQIRTILSTLWITRARDGAVRPRTPATRPPGRGRKATPARGVRPKAARRPCWELPPDLSGPLSPAPDLSGPLSPAPDPSVPLSPAPDLSGPPDPSRSPGSSGPRALVLALVLALALVLVRIGASEPGAGHSLPSVTGAGRSPSWVTEPADSRRWAARARARARARRGGASRLGLSRHRQAGSGTRRRSRSLPAGARTRQPTRAPSPGSTRGHRVRAPCRRADGGARRRSGAR